MYVGICLSTLNIYVCVPLNSTEATKNCSISVIISPYRINLFSSSFWARFKHRQLYYITNLRCEGQSVISLVCAYFLVTAGETNNISWSLSLDAKLSSKDIHPNTTYELQHPILEDGKFYIPQCHSQQRNFSLTEQTPVSITETHSHLGDVLLGSVRQNLTITSAESDTYKLYCAMTSYTIGCKSVS